MMVRPAAFILLMAIVLVGLWSVFKPQQPRANAPASRDSRTADAPSISTIGTQPWAGGAGSPARQSSVFELVVRAGKLASGPSVLRVHEGERVNLLVKSDSSDEVHLHGYDLHARLAPGATANLEFTANHTGRFGLELHKVHSELAALEVYPR
ncbi:MAG TPA: hypothetical protein VG425_00270 [Casimicrobiaceae bacterium]|jgi:hypothetical protein|nr:hypothetical protein [Casimicrobiaceae bacterium]